MNYNIILNKKKQKCAGLNEKRTFTFYHYFILKKKNLYSTLFSPIFKFDQNIYFLGFFLFLCAIVAQNILTYIVYFFS